MTHSAWAPLLAFNAGLIVVLTLRPLWRLHLGPRAAYALWLLPLLAAVATQFPRAVDGWSPSVLVLDRAISTVASIAPAAGSDGSNWFALIWLAGSLLASSPFVAAGQRLQRQLRGVPVESDPRAEGLTVLRADFGPALLGLVRPVLVLPRNFEQSYTPAQQALAIAHECAHYRAGDLWVRSLALLLAICQWFNPLAWWSLQYLIEDQESACDARVLAGRPQDTPDYARALAAGESALPASGALMCSLHPKHPLLRRIAMLNCKPASQSRRMAATLFTLVILGAGSVLAWANGSDSMAQPADSAEFRIQINLQIDEGEYQEFGLGTRASEAARARIADPAGDVDLQVAVDRTAVANEVLLRLVVERDGVEVGRPAVVVKLNGDARIDIGEQSPNGYRGIRLDLTVSAPAELVHVAQTSTSARTLAIEVATRAGLRVENADLLPESPVEARFDGIQAESVLQLLAHSHGLKIIRSGNSMRLEKP